jgi:aryl-alcohol dehydrogenase-like predicted oxidoreductase
VRYVALPNGLPSASVLGLGCAAMMGSASRRESVDAIAAAANAGINFFDTARSYGYGESESLLGDYFACRRDKVIFCTKFGILPTAPGWKQSLKPVARAALKFVPALGNAARAHAGQPAANQFSVETLRSSLETSLQALGTDYVDILLMHAAPMSVFAQEDLLDELGRLVDEGKVRLAGISGEHDVISATFAARPPVLQTAQFAVNVDTLSYLNEIPSEPKMFLVANQPFGGTSGVAETRRRIEGLHKDVTLPAELREKLDFADSQLLPELILNAILSGTAIDAVIPAMLTPAHLQANCDAVTRCRFTAGELTRLRQILVSGK